MTDTTLAVDETVTAADETVTAESTRAHGVSLTDAAAAKVKSLLEQEGRDDLRLRVAVQPGGCSRPDLPAVLRRALPRGR